MVTYNVVDGSPNEPRTAFAPPRRGPGAPRPAARSRRERPAAPAGPPATLEYTTARYMPPGSPVYKGDLALFPGMTANCTIVTNRKDNTLRVPSAALRFNPGAFVPIEDKKPAAGPMAAMAATPAPAPGAAPGTAPAAVRAPPGAWSPNATTACGCWWTASPGPSHAWRGSATGRSPRCPAIGPRQSDGPGDQFLARAGRPRDQRSEVRHPVEQHPPGTRRYRR